VSSGTTGKYHFLAMAYVPAENPAYAIGISVEYLGVSKGEDTLNGMLKELAKTLLETKDSGK
jgi:cell division protein FtsI/penicillin-binding protein 2